MSAAAGPSGRPVTAQEATEDLLADIIGRLRFEARTSRYIARAVVEAVRALPAEQVAELIGGETEARVGNTRRVDRDVIRYGMRERVVGPWIETEQP